MPTVFASIVISNTDRECGRIFSEKRNQFRGLFDIFDLKVERTGDWKEGFTYYTFVVKVDKKDAPVVLSILRELEFKTKYI